MRTQPIAHPLAQPYRVRNASTRTKNATVRHFRWPMARRFTLVEPRHAATPAFPN